MTFLFFSALKKDRKKKDMYIFYIFGSFNDNKTLKKLYLHLFDNFFLFTS